MLCSSVAALMSASTLTHGPSTIKWSYLQPRHLSLSTFSTAESRRSSIKIPSSIKTSAIKLSAGPRHNLPFDICSEEEFLEEEPCDRIYSKRGETNAEKNGQVLGDGIVLLRNYLSLDEQVDIIRTCRDVGLGSGGFYRPTNRNGTPFRLHMMCLGLDWNPVTRLYDEIREHDGALPPPIPSKFSSLVENALDDSRTLIKSRIPGCVPEKILPLMTPDLCIVNYYDTKGGLGLHQDKDESKESIKQGLPIVSISLGDSAVFRYSNGYVKIYKADEVVLMSGDVFVFGGKSRNLYHGVTSIIPNTAPPLLVERAKLRPGRVNLTFRKY